ncbi:TPA: hypothetical protein L9G47_002081 [Klebsiella quasipneumoniae]|nr:hypothetical protein [Klebsiella quasipneumoniae]HBR0204849.1 hypothetical protein [Klebsiella quasipneumoniae]HBR0328362.1 hypothetical protein [Klebsiella quasipneumoniae]
MTITLQAVNELIASLESAGELSIREQKFLKLAKEFRICSASLDAAIKTGNMLADQNAQLAAENVEAKKIISECREYFIAGVMNRIRPTNEGYLHMICDTFADETPATARIVAGIKADGVEEFAAKLRIPGDDQFFDALAKGVALAADDFAKQLREGADK